MQQIVSNQRHRRVQLEIPGNRAEGDRRIVPDHLGADLDHHIADHGVDLAGHDGRAGLSGGQLQFPKTQARPGTQPANVVGDLDQAHGKGLERAARFHAGVARGLRL